MFHYIMVAAWGALLTTPAPIWYNRLEMNITGADLSIDPLDNGQRAGLALATSLHNPYDPNRSLAGKELVKEQEEEAKADLVRQVRGIIATFVSNANWVYDLHKRAIQEIDEILRSPEGSVESLNPRHWAMIKEMQKIYTPTNVGVVMRLLEPDANFGPAFQLNITMGTEQINSDEARRIAVRDLLKKFDASQKYRVPETIEGEVVGRDG